MVAVMFLPLKARLARPKVVLPASSMPGVESTSSRSASKSLPLVGGRAKLRLKACSLEDKGSMIIWLVPKAESWSLMSFWKPSVTASITVIAITPMTMPKMVSRLRSRWWRRLLTEYIMISISFMLLVPQGDYGVDFGSIDRREGAGEYPHQDREYDGSDYYRRLH